MTDRVPAADAVVVGELRRDGDSGWHFVHVPTSVRARWSVHARRGAIRVAATIGGSTWAGSLLPWADGSAQLSVPAPVRRREGLAEGDVVRLLLRPRLD